MKLRILRNLGPEWPKRWRENQIADVDTELGERLLQAGLAEAPHLQAQREAEKKAAEAAAGEEPRPEAKKTAKG